MPSTARRLPTIKSNKIAFDIVKGWLEDLGANPARIVETRGPAVHRGGGVHPACAVRVDGKALDVFTYEMRNVNYIATHVARLQSVDDIHTHRERLMRYATMILTAAASAGEADVSDQEAPDASPEA